MPSLLVQSPPLHPLPTLLNVQVPLYLNVPLIESNSEKKKSVWIDLFSLLFTLEISLVKWKSLQVVKETKGNEDRFNVITKKVDDPSLDSQTTDSILCLEDQLRSLTTLQKDLFQQIHSLLKTYPSFFMDKQPLDIKHCLMHYQLDTFFPCICEGDPLTLPTTSFSSSSSSSSLIQSFDFKYFSTLNQVVTLCLHLRQDMNLTNHKYIAHQLALLYQSLGNTREDLKVFKSEIESQFDVIKAVCSVSEGDPKLSPDQRDWVRDLSTRILTQTLFHQRTTTSNTTTTTTPPILDTYPCTPFYQLLQSL